MNFNELLRDQRIKKNMTMVELGQKLNCAQSVISNWESGKAFPHPKFYDLINKHLDIDVRDYESKPIASEPAGAYCTHHTDIDKMYNTLSATIASLVESNKMLTETNAKIVAALVEHYSKV